MGQLYQYKGGDSFRVSVSSPPRIGGLLIGCREISRPHASSTLPAVISRILLILQPFRVELLSRSSSSPQLHLPARRTRPSHTTTPRFFLRASIELARSQVLPDGQIRKYGSLRASGTPHTIFGGTGSLSRFPRLLEAIHIPNYTVHSLSAKPI